MAALTAQRGDWNGWGAYLSSMLGEGDGILDCIRVSGYPISGGEYAALKTQQVQILGMSGLIVPVADVLLARGYRGLPTETPAGCVRYPHIEGK